MGRLVKMKKSTYLFLLVLLFFFKVQAQVYSPFSQSNFAGIYGVSQNPSFTALDKHSWHLNLIGAGINANNNYLRLDMPYSPYRAINDKIPRQYQTASGNPDFRKSWLLRKVSTRPKHASAQAHIMGPSLLIKVKSWKLGLVTEGYGNARAFSIDRKLADIVYLEFDSAAGAYDQAIKESYRGGDINTKGGTLTGSGYAAIGFHASRAWDLQWNQKISAGITPKLAFGGGFGGLSYSDFDITSLFNDSFRISKFSAESRYSLERRIAFATDIGVTYVYNKPTPRQSGNYRKNKTKYHSKIGLAILNIGRFKYNANFTSVESSSAISLAKSDFDNLNTSDADSGASQLFENYGVVNQSIKRTKVGLPTVLHISVDHQVRQNIFVATSWVQSLRKRNSYHMRQQSYLLVTPRYETKHWEVGIPLGLLYDYRSLRMGLYTRFGPLFIGTHSLNGFLNTRNVSDADFFIGISVGRIGKPKSKIEREKENLKQDGGNKCDDF